MDFYLILSGTLAKEDIEKEIQKKIDEFHGLLTREVALKLIAKERGLYKEEEQVIKIKDIKTNMRKITFFGEIIAIHKETIYSSGKRAMSIVIKDDTGHIGLTLWNNDIFIISKLKIGDKVLIKNAYEKLGGLSLGYAGSIDLVSVAPYKLLKDLEDGPVNIRGFICSIEGEKTYQKNGKAYVFSSFKITDSFSERNCIIWGKHKSENIIVGNEVIINNAWVKKGEIQINERTRLLVKKSKDIISGLLHYMQVNDNNLIIKIGDKTLHFNRENALKFFGLQIKDDIMLDTIVSLKKESMLNNNIYLHCKEANGEYIILSSQ